MSVRRAGRSAAALARSRAALHLWLLLDLQGQHWFHRLRLQVQQRQALKLQLAAEEERLSEDLLKRSSAAAAQQAAIARVHQRSPELQALRQAIAAAQVDLQSLHECAALQCFGNGCCVLVLRAPAQYCSCCMLERMPSSLV